MNISVNFDRNHKKYILIDPFASIETQIQCVKASGDKKADFIMEGYQDVLLILGADSIPSAAVQKSCSIIDIPYCGSDI